MGVFAVTAAVKDGKLLVGGHLGPLQKQSNNGILVERGLVFAGKLATLR